MIRVGFKNAVSKGGIVALIRASPGHTLSHPTGPRTHRFDSPDGQPLSWAGTTQSPKGTLLLRAGTSQRQLAGAYPGVANGADQLLGLGVSSVPQGGTIGAMATSWVILVPCRQLLPYVVLHCLSRTVRLSRDWEKLRRDQEPVDL